MRHFLFSLVALMGLIAQIPAAAEPPPPAPPLTPDEELAKFVFQEPGYRLEPVVSDPIIKSLSFERKLTSSEAHQHCMALPARKLTDMSTSPTPSPSPLARPPVRPSTPHWCRPARRHPGCPRRQRSKGAVRIGAGGLPGPVAAGGAGRHRRTVRPGAALGSHDDTVRQRDLSCLRNQHGH